MGIGGVPEASLTLRYSLHEGSILTIHHLCTELASCTISPTCPGLGVLLLYVVWEELVKYSVFCSMSLSIVSHTGGYRPLRNMGHQAEPATAVAS